MVDELELISHHLVNRFIRWPLTGAFLVKEYLPYKSVVEHRCLPHLQEAGPRTVGEEWAGLGVANLHVVSPAAEAALVTELVGSPIGIKGGVSLLSTRGNFP